MSVSPRLMLIATMLLARGAAGQGEVARAATLLDRLAGYGYSGVTAIAHGEDPPRVIGVGMAVRESGVSVTPDDGFDIGSLTKPFTAAVILRLVEMGTLRLEDSLASFFTTAPADKQGITIHQLLTHSSGMVRSAASLGVEPETARDEFVQRVLEAALLYPPGERYEYSDTGYDLLAAIAERATGKPFATLVSSHVLEPAGLRATRYASADDSLPIAPSYADALGSPWLEDREGPSTATWFNRGSGGLISTAADLVRFAQALRGGQVLTAAMASRMMEPHVKVSTDRGYGYGWFVEQGADGRVISHGGDIAGYKAFLSIDRGRDLIQATLGNALGWERVADTHIPATLRGRGPDLPPEVQHDAPPVAPPPVGTYRLTNGPGMLVIWEEDGRLVVEVEGVDPAAVLFATDAAVLAARSAGTRAMLHALTTGDGSAVATMLRDRDRLQGMAKRYLGMWQAMMQRAGGIDSTVVIGSVPAQDGTIVSFVRLLAAGGSRSMVLRVIWRGDRLVAIGDGGALRRPTAILHPVGAGGYARFETSTGITSRIEVEAAGRLALRTPASGLTLVRDTVHPVAPPPVPATRALLQHFVQRGGSAGLAALDSLRRESPARHDLSESALNDLGYAVLAAGNRDAAVALFARVVEEHPESANAHDSLGEARLANGDRAGALRSYRRSLELDPDNAKARDIIRELERTAEP